VRKGLHTKTLRTVAAGLSFALMTACQTAVTPKSTTEEGTRSTHTLREEPHRAAVCVARNIDEYKHGFTARILQGAAPVLVEVHVRADEVIALAQFLILGEGSTVLIWTARNTLYRSDELIAAMIAGC
jgi:hypothetical protein